MNERSGRTYGDSEMFGLMIISEAEPFDSRLHLECGPVKVFDCL